MVEDDFTHTHGLGSDFDKLILLDVFEALFQRHDGLGDDAGFLIGTRGTFVIRVTMFAVANGMIY